MQHLKYFVHFTAVILLLKLYLLILEGRGAHATVLVWRSDNKPQGSVLRYQWVLGTKQFVKLGKLGDLYPLSHVDGSVCTS